MTNHETGKVLLHTIISTKDFKTVGLYRCISKIIYFLVGNAIGAKFSKL